ncbi:BTB/POZ domain-containing protein 18 [Lithobates pipiens]
MLDAEGRDQTAPAETSSSHIKEMATGRRLSYWNPRLLRTVFLQLQQQQEGGLFCDVVLQGDGDGLPVHSCVIAACSPYLAKLLRCPVDMSAAIADSEGRVLCNRRILNLSGIPNNYLLPLVRYMYTSELEVAPADAYDVLKIAQKLRIPVLENLKLEGGRIVRPETGRKLNRGCLSSRKQTHQVENDLQHNGIRLINDEVCIHEDDKPFVQGSVNHESPSPDIPDNIASRQSLEQTIPSKQNLQDSLGKDEPHIKVRLKRLYNSPDVLSNQNNLSTVSEQNKSSPKIFIDPVKEYGEEKQEIHEIPGNVNPKRRKLNRGEKLGVLPESAVSMSHSGKLNDNLINISNTGNTGKRTCANTGLFMVKDGLNNSELPNVQCDASHMDKGIQININDSQSAKHLKRSPLNKKVQNGQETEESEGSVFFIGMDSKDANKDEYVGISDSTLSYSRTCSDLEDLSRADSDLIDVHKDNIAGVELRHAGFSNSEATMKCLPSSTADKSGKIQTCPKVPSVLEVEKVKLRKIKNGPSWEIVKDPDTASASENVEHMNQLEELLEQMLNMPSPSSDVDVGGSSPVIWIAEGVWPDLSSESDEEIEVLH